MEKRHLTGILTQQSLQVDGVQHFVVYAIVTNFLEGFFSVTLVVSIQFETMKDPWNKCDIGGEIARKFKEHHHPNSAVLIAIA